MIEQGYNIDKHVSLISKKIIPNVSLEEIYRNKIKYKDLVTYDNLSSGLDRTKNDVSPGLDGMTKADITEKRLRKLHSELVAQTYQPTPSKKVGIPKPDGGVRYLGVASQIDKIVQATILNKLEPILEKEFLDCSFGFRPGIGCHNALKQIKYGWKAVTWIINVDIKKCFDSLNHEFMLQRASLYCDQATVELIRKLIKVGYVDVHLKRYTEGVEVGTPQGSLISPLLCNLYLHELDKYVVKELLPLYNKGEYRAKPSEYASRYNLNEKDKEIISIYPELKSAMKRVKHKRTVLSGRYTASDGQDPKFRRLFYIRYADDFLIGFTGPKSEADEIMNLIKGKLKSIHLEANENKSGVFHSSDNGILYLGMYIRYFHHNKTIKEEIQNAGDIEKRVNKLKAQAINTAHFRVPVDRILKRLVDRGVAKAREDGTVRSTAFIRYSMMEDQDIVNRFNAIIRGLLNYYSCVNHRSDLWKILSILRKSCALTLAHKHKEKSAARVFRKLGPSLTIRNAIGQEVAKLQYPESLKTSIDFKIRETGISPNVVDIEFDKVQGSSKLNLKVSDVCQYEGCDSTQNLEAHHLNPMSNISKRKDLSAFEKALIQRKRKVVMLCKKHHNYLHGKGILATETEKIPSEDAKERLGLTTSPTVKAKPVRQSKPKKA